MATRLACRRQHPLPLLVSCVGRDAAGGALVADLSSRGLPLRGILRPPKAATATVSIVFDGSGEACRSSGSAACWKYKLCLGISI
jgi:sugar/nucleoside kinase (ribokinase family)